ncbi:unnamed protein product, partial [Musa acuminata var. zebrina]
KGGGDGYRAGEGDRWACPRVHQDRGLRHPPCLVITLTLEAPRRPHLCEGGPPWSKEKGAGYGDGEGQRVVFPPLHWAVRLLQVPHPRHPGAPRVSPHRLPLPHASPSSASPPPMPRPCTAAASPPPSSSPATSTPCSPTCSPWAPSSPSLLTP